MSTANGSTGLAEVVEVFTRRLWAGEDPDPADVVLAHPHRAADLEAQRGP